MSKICSKYTKAELDNKKIDISTNCILTGSNYQNENLPHILNPLQGEVWFIAAKDAEFIAVKEPILTIHTAAKKYVLGMCKDMFIISKNHE